MPQNSVERPFILQESSDTRRFVTAITSVLGLPWPVYNFLPRWKRTFSSSFTDLPPPPLAIFAFSLQPVLRQARCYWDQQERCKHHSSDKKKKIHRLWCPIPECWEKDSRQIFVIKDLIRSIMTWIIIKWSYFYIFNKSLEG